MWAGARVACRCAMCAAPWVVRHTTRRAACRTIHGPRTVRGAVRGAARITIGGTLSGVVCTVRDISFALFRVILAGSCSKGSSPSLLDNEHDVLSNFPQYQIGKKRQKNPSAHTTHTILLRNTCKAHAQKHHTSTVRDVCTPLCSKHSLPGLFWGYACRIRGPFTFIMCLCTITASFTASLYCSAC
jgi:hypothetical protein